MSEVHVVIRFMVSKGPVTSELIFVDEDVIVLLVG